jgi:Flp pilus assembly protein TadD
MRLALSLCVLLLATWGAAAQDATRDFQAGRDAYREGRQQDAVDRFLACARERPDDPLVNSWLATSLLAVGRAQEAATLLQGVIAVQPGDAVAHTNLGLAYQGMNLVDAAVLEYQEAMRLDPTLWDARNNLATANVALGRLADAEALWRDQLALAPGDRAATLSLALLFERGQRYAEAKQLLAPQPGTVAEPLFAPHLARVLVLAGEPDAGLAAMAALESERSLPPRVREDFAVALVQAGRIQDALARLEDPTLRGALTARGLTAYAEALGTQQRWLDMFTALSEVSRAPDFQQRWLPAERATVFARLAWLAERAGDKPAAESHARAALGLDPAQATALAVLQRLGLGQDELRDLEATMAAGSPSLQTIQRYAELACGRAGYQSQPAALTVLEQVGSEDVVLLNRIAVLLLRGGRAQPAMERLSRAIGLDDTNAIAHNNLGVAYEILGRLEEATREYSIAVRLDPASKEAQANLARMPRADHE